MKLSRRTFFKAGAVGVTTLAAATSRADAAPAATAAPGAKAMLVDTTRCIGCRSCEAACAEANHLGEPAMMGDDAVFKGRRVTDSHYFTVVNRVTPDPERYVKTQCMHCVDPACASACPGRALEKTAAGPVIYTGSRCLGCRYCMVACQFGVPKFQYESNMPYVRKCSFCAERQQKGLMPACAEACPAGTLTFGDRATLLEEARTRIYQNPTQYVHHIYGEQEAGGTSWLYISDVTPEQLGLKTGVDLTPIPELAGTALAAVPMVLTLWPPVLMGLYALRGHPADPESPAEEEESRHD